MYNVNKNKHANTVLGLDCEMCYTMKGLEVCKIAIVNINGDLVYYTLVKPDNKIIDYNSRFSGVSEKDFTNKKYRSLKEVHEDLKNIVFCDTIVIGHGLENDLRVLKLIHKNIIDTSIIFPHFLGLPFRRSLRSLALSYLNKPIQFEVSGHDSREDAKSCIELMLWKIRNDLINDL
ncbi:putative exonuclease GOR [Lycorma delicatula]|uniref:putative exonuclease GOR n=1 Tax=Lycorma delicatula TaxID=130591 RepID=UPI003F51131D